MKNFIIMLLFSLGTTIFAQSVPKDSINGTQIIYYPLPQRGIDDHEGYRYAVLKRMNKRIELLEQINKKLDVIIEQTKPVEINWDNPIDPLYYEWIDSITWGNDPWYPNWEKYNVIPVLDTLTLDSLVLKIGIDTITVKPVPVY